MGSLGELPLAIFTTLVPIASGMFIPYAIWCYSANQNESDTRGLNKLSLTAAVIFIVAFIAASFHLGNIVNAPDVVYGVGRAPLSNEVLMAALFFALVVILIVGEHASSSLKFRKVIATLLVIAGVLLAAFTGLAYFMPTVISWASPWVVVEQLGFYLMGSIVGLLVLSVVNVSFTEKQRTQLRNVILVGFIVVVIGMIGHFAQVSGMHGVYTSGLVLAEVAMPYAVVGAICLFATAALSIVSMKKNAVPFGVASSVLLVIGVFLCRVAFYCMQLGIGA